MNNGKIEDVILVENKITRDVIDNLKKPYFNLIKNNEVVDYIHKYCKKLLSYSMKNHSSKEMAYAINLTNLDFVGAAFGDVRTIDITPLVRLMDNKNHVYMVIHNHPSDNPFSPRDLDTFFSTSNLMILIVVGNKGSIYVIEKCTRISKEEYLDIKKHIINYKKNIMNFSEIIEELSKYNIFYSSL